MAGRLRIVSWVDKVVVDEVPTFDCGMGGKLSYVCESSKGWLGHYFTFVGHSIALRSIGVAGCAAAYRGDEQAAGKLVHAAAAAGGGGGRERRLQQGARS